MNSTDFRSQANEVMAMLSHVEALQRPVRPAALPQRLDAAQPGDVLVVIDASATPALRRLATVNGLDGGAILVDGERFHRGHGFALAGLATGNLARFVQPVDGWSVPGWSGSLALEL